MKPAVVCVGDSGINGLATVRALGRRGVPVHVVALQTSGQIASASRYCRSFTPAADLSTLHATLLGLEAGAVLYVDNDPMLKALAPHAGALAGRFALVDEIAEAPRLALDVKTWRPYLGRKEWAVYAPDDPAPWRKALRQLGGWLFTRRSFVRVAARLSAPRA